MDFTAEVEKYSTGEHDRYEILTWLTDKSFDFEFMFAELFRYTSISEEFDDFVEEKVQSLIKYADGMHRVGLHNMGKSNYDTLREFLQDKANNRVPPIEWIDIYRQQDKMLKKNKKSE